MKWVGGDYTDTCVQHSTTGIAPIAEEITDIQLYPNPCFKLINIDFTLTKMPSINGQVKMDVVDMMGRIILSDYFTSRLGFNHFNIDVSRLGVGNYVLQISGDMPLVSIQFTKQ